MPTGTHRKENGSTLLLRSLYQVKFRTLSWHSTAVRGGRHDQNQEEAATDIKWKARPVKGGHGRHQEEGTIDRRALTTGESLRRALKTGESLRKARLQCRKARPISGRHDRQKPEERTIDIRKARSTSGRHYRLKLVEGTTDVGKARLLEG